MDVRLRLAALACLLCLAAACSPPAPEDPLLRIRQWEDSRTLPADSVQTLLDSTPWRIRQAACRAMGRIGDPAARPLLERRLADDDNAQVRAEAAFALGLLALPETAPALVAQLGRETDVGALGEIVLALGRLDDAPEGTTAALLPWVGSAHPHVREQALEALALRADSTAIDALLQATHDDVESVVWRAAYALEKIPGSRQVSRLVELTGHPSSLVRRYALRSLGRLQAVDALESMVAAAEAAGDDWQVEVMAADALGRLGTEGALEPLVSLTHDRNFHVRAAACAALGRLDRPEAATVLRAGLDDESVDVRMAALAALADCAGALAAPDLEEGLEDPSELVVGMCLARLGEVAPPRAMEILPGWLTAHPTSSQRYRAFEGLGATQDPASVPRLREGITDRDWVVEVTAIDQLAQRGDTEVVPRLLERYRQVEGPGAVDVRLQILQALGTLGDPRAVDRLEETLASAPQTRLRLAARESLASLLPEAKAARLPTARDIRRDVRAVIRSPQQPPLVRTSAAAHLILLTDRGRIVIDLLGEEAPQTVESFARLADDGFFDGLSFHRVVPNFVIQGGDPRGNGWGDAGYTLRSEWNPLRYERGTVGIAHSGKDTGSCQLFITQSPQPHLNARYTIWGTVSQGMEVVDAIQMGDRFTAEVRWSER
jgi:HEAT repeat protein